MQLKRANFINSSSSPSQLMTEKERDMNNSPLIHQVDLLLVPPPGLVFILHEIDLLLCLVLIFGEESLPVILAGQVLILYPENLQVSRGSQSGCRHSAA